MRMKLCTDRTIQVEHIVSYIVSYIGASIDSYESSQSTHTWIANVKTLHENDTLKKLFSKLHVLHYALLILNWVESRKKGNYY